MRAHIFRTHPSLADTTWPGVEMTRLDNGWYELQLDGVERASLVFNDAHGAQTEDLDRDRVGWYEPGVGWSSTPPETFRSDQAQVSVTERSDLPDSVTSAPPERAASDGLADFRQETIYFLITTRFYDGDPSNNFFCRDRVEFDRQGNPVDPHWRGDFKGLIERLDYIRDLGFTAIWITPPIENRSGLDYHGYHGYDWTRIDPRLESPGATYQDLIDAMHARGMKLIQDVVVNHSCQYGIRGRVFINHLPVKYFVPQGKQPGQHHHGPYRGNLGNYTHPFREDNDNPVAPAWFRARQNSDPEGLVPLVDPNQASPCPAQDIALADFLASIHTTSIRFGTIKMASSAAVIGKVGRYNPSTSLATAPI